MYKTIDLKSLNAANHMTEEEIAGEQLIIEASKSNPQVFGKIYDRYYEGIFHFVYRRTEDEDLTADLCSQTFLKALQHLKTYEFRGLPFSAWLYRIASNEVNKFYSKKKKNRLFSVETGPIFELFETEEKEFTQEQEQILLSTLKALSTKTIEVLELRFFEERSFKEIAFILNLSESGAKMRLYRAVEKLKEHFKINARE